MTPAEYEQRRTFLLAQPGPIEDTPEALDVELARLDAEATAGRRAAREAGTDRAAVEEAGHHRRRAWVLVRLAEHRGGPWHEHAAAAVTNWDDAEADAVTEAVRDQLATEAEGWLSTQGHAGG